MEKDAHAEQTAISNYWCLCPFTHEPDREAAASRAILLFACSKAWDTVPLELLCEVLRYFEFADSFIVMIRRLHDGTTAIFLVNGNIIGPPIRRGRHERQQDCPLALLLIVLVAEILTM